MSSSGAACRWRRREGGREAPPICNRQIAGREAVAPLWGAVRGAAAGRVSQAGGNGTKHLLPRRRRGDLRCGRLARRGLRRQHKRGANGVRRNCGNRNVAIFGAAAAARASSRRGGGELLLSQYRRWWRGWPEWRCERLTAAVRGEVFAGAARSAHC